LRNILEGILEANHLFGLHPYPYNSFLITFIHFPLFYCCTFLSITLILSLFSPKIRTEGKQEYKKVVSTVANMFYIIIIPPIIDFIISKGRGYELSYLLEGGNILVLLSLPFNPLFPLSGVSVGMKLEIIITLILVFIWVFIKRKNIFLSLFASYSIYLFLLFIAALPLLIANLFGQDFASFYSRGGILFFDTQKFAAVMFILFFILITSVLLLFFNANFKNFFRPHPLQVILILVALAGFLLGLKKFLSIKPDLFLPSDYLAIIVFIISIFLVSQIYKNGIYQWATGLGLFSSLIISYYTFLALLCMAIILRLKKKSVVIINILFLLFATFFAFCAGLSVFTQERTFSALSFNEKYYQIKTQWNEVEVLLKSIEQKIKNGDGQYLADFFSSKPYFASVPAIVYLEGLYNIKTGKYPAAERLIEGAVKLGYKTEKVYLTLGNVNLFQKKYYSAIKIYESLVVSKILTPYDAEIFNNLGVAYLQIKEYKKARELFKKALNLKPEFIEAGDNLRFVESMMDRGE